MIFSTITFSDDEAKELLNALASIPAKDWDAYMVRDGLATRVSEALTTRQ
jgi:hypothetical protein